MGFIHITSFVSAPANIVCDLSRHMLLQKKAMEKIGARQIRGVSSGLLSDNEIVLWAIRMWRKEVFFSLKITESTAGHFIREEMMQGGLESFKHLRHFKHIQNGTLVIDEIFYTMPKKFWSVWIDRLWLNKTLYTLLEERNKILRDYAETNKWKALLTK